MKLTVRDLSGQSQGELEVRWPVIENHKGTQAVYEAVVAHQAARRMGTACTKTMGEVAGSGKKPWRQKGTGRARAGSFASPLWRGGGVVFGPKPRDFRLRIPKAVRRLALRKALSARLTAGDVVVVDQLTLPSAKTKEMVRVLAALELAGSALVVAEGVDVNLQRASRNLPRVELTTSDALHPYQVLRYDKLLFTRGALAKLERRLAGP
jgi:large subunit ribosomal protein L4